MEAGPIELLIIQGSPLCNIDCKYCYLPNRASSRRISTDILRATFQRVLHSEFLSDRLTILWHAGEPLALPREFYETAIEISQKQNVASVQLEHCFQTNATLIDQSWCEFFRTHRAKIGVSIDGPSGLHDRQRVTRRGRPTHAQAMRGVKLLQKNDLPFYAICVLTADSLDQPDAIYHFFRENGFTYVGFNAEEAEGIHELSSLKKLGTEDRFRSFMTRILELSHRTPDGPKIREFDLLHRQLFQQSNYHVAHGQQLTPYRIISVDVEGNYYTWCPEFLDMKSEKYQNFAIGNVLTTSLREAVNGSVFRQMEQDIQKGINRCRAECPYFNTCGGGAPVNKFSENGAFETTQTNYCRLRNQLLVDVYLDYLEAQNTQGVDP